MNESIKVKVTRHRGRKFLIMYYDDPMTGKREQRSTKETTKTKAERAAAKWEAELREGRYKPASKITWAEFRQRYEDEAAVDFAKKTDAMVTTVFNHVERIINPRRLMDVTVDRLSHMRKVLNDEKKSRASIETYLGHLQTALQWAVTMGLLPTAPKAKTGKRASGDSAMKGRPITLEEFERMLDKVQPVLFPKGFHKKDADKAARQRAAVESWKRLLLGLWYSGLRISEAMEVYWDRTDRHSVDFSGRRPMFVIRGEWEKGGKDRLLPMTPDFAEFLAETPEEERTGPIFAPIGSLLNECRRGDWASKVISKFGKKAGIKVNTNAVGKVKFASAHDLRRSFGERWAMRVMPVVLKQLMRHEKIETTMRYYVGQNAAATADAVWEAAGVGTSVGTSQKPPAEKEKASP